MFTANSKLSIKWEIISDEITSIKSLVSLQTMLLLRVRATSYIACYINKKLLYRPLLVIIMKTCILIYNLYIISLYYLQKFYICLEW